LGLIDIKFEIGIAASIQTFRHPLRYDFTFK
jgi:hypothetical protein